MDRRRALAWLVLAFLSLLAAPAAAQRGGHRGGGARDRSRSEPLGGTIEEIRTRPGVTQPFLVVRPSGSPVATVILFTGGDGVLGLGAGGMESGANNFLVRNRQRFADRGFLVAVLDAPSDHATGLGRFRASAEHAEDVKAVIAFLRGIAKVPLWLVGTSRGTVSAANAAARLQDGGADGLVLTSSLTEPHRESLHDVDLTAIRIPTLVVHNRSDQCGATPYRDAPVLLASLVNAPAKELVTFDGGDTPRSDPCEGLSYHGYLGLDGDVVAAIAEWIKRGGPR